MSTEPGVGCLDEDECSSGIHGFSTHSTCVNSVGSFSCECDSGFSGNGFICDNVNECVIGSHSCDTNVLCNDNIGSFTCTCFDGFEGNGYFCKDVNECTTSGHHCHRDASCININSGYDCGCIGNGFTIKPFVMTSFPVDNDVIGGQACVRFKILG